MTKKEKTKWIVPSIAIVVLAAIEITALVKGINGALLTLIVGAICAIAGYKYPK